MCNFLSGLEEGEVPVTSCSCPRYSVKVVKAAGQVLNTLWQYRDLRSLYRQVSMAMATPTSSTPAVLLYTESESVQSLSLY